MTQQVVEVRISIPNQLRQALLYSERVGYDRSPLGIEVSGILSEMKSMEIRAREACEKGDVLEIEKILDESHSRSTTTNTDRIGLRSETANDWNNGAEEGQRCPLLIRETQIKCRQLLNLPTSRLNQLRLRSAIQRNDVDAIVQATVDIKTSYFDHHHNLASFELENLPCLRRLPVSNPRNHRAPRSSSRLSRSSSPLGINQTEEERRTSSVSNLSFSAIPIQTSVMNMRSLDDVEVSMKMFKNVFKSK